MNSNEIDIASYLTRIESSGDPVNNILAVSLDLAEELKIVVGKEERLKIKNNEIPILEVSPILKKGCTEILMWPLEFWLPLGQCGVLPLRAIILHTRTILSILRLLKM